MLRARRTALAILAAVGTTIALPGAASAGCGTVTTVGAIYIDDRSAASGDATDVWLYLESNGVAGLQAGGRSPTGLYRDTECVESANPDQLIF